MVSLVKSVVPPAGSVSKPVSNKISDKNFSNYLSNVLEEVKQTGKKADHSAQAYTMGIGNIAQAALDTTVWQTTVDVATGLRNEIVGGIKKILDTPL